MTGAEKCSGLVVAATYKLSNVRAWPQRALLNTWLENVKEESGTRLQ